MHVLCHLDANKQPWLVAPQGVARRKDAPEPVMYAPGESSFPICIGSAESKEVCMASAENGPNCLRHFGCFSSAPQASLLGFKTPSANRVLETSPSL